MIQEVFGGVAIEAILDNTRVQASAAAAQRQLIQGNFESLWITFESLLNFFGSLLNFFESLLNIFESLLNI